MKGCREKEEGVERVKGQGWKKDSDEGEEKIQDVSTWCWYHQLFLPLLFSFFFSYVQYQSWSAWPNELLRNEKESKHWTYPPLVMEILAFRWVPDKDNRGIYMFYSLLNSPWFLVSGLAEEMELYGILYQDHSDRTDWICLWTSLSWVYSYECRPQVSLSVYFYVCVHVCTVLPRQKGSDCLMKSLSFWRGREVDALH